MLARFQPVAPRSRVKHSTTELPDFLNCDVFLTMKVVLILSFSADPDEMQHDTAFHLGLHCLQKYQLRGFHYESAVAQW